MRVSFSSFCLLWSNIFISFTVMWRRVRQSIEVNRMYAAPHEPIATGGTVIQNPSCLRPASYLTQVFNGLSREGIHLTARAGCVSKGRVCACLHLCFWGGRLRREPLVPSAFGMGSIQSLCPSQAACVRASHETEDNGYI